jgi:membrane-associated phospholipid phosphatase
MSAVAAAVTAHGWAVLLLRHLSAATLVVLSAALASLAGALGGARRAWAVALTPVVTVLAAQALKTVLARPALSSATAMNSLPSGHVAAAAGLAVAAVLAVDRSLRVTVAVIGTVTVAITGLATVTLQWHRPSDVVAAALLAVAVGALAERLTSRRSRTAEGPGEQAARRQ